MKEASGGLEQKRSRTGIVRQLNEFLIIGLLPFLIMTGAIMFMLVSFNKTYTSALQNANIAADFNSAFKEDIDLAMWYYIVNAKPADELPWADVSRAEDVLNRLKRTTNTGGNRWRLSSMQNIIDNLGDYMRDIADTPLYNDKIDKLNKNIYTTTALFHIYMQDYIYDEVRELTQLQQDIGRRQVIILLVTLIAFIVLVALILSYSLRFARRITRPITQLVRKAEKIGSGDFSIEPIRTGAKELQLLDEGVNEMAERIHALLEKEVQDQKALHRAELELLRAQINPHFLYNTLDSIVWLAEAKKNDDVVKMVTSLSVFFRNSLGRGQDVITLREEQDQVRSYLEIQKIRYNDILVYDIDISEELLRFAIPKLTLQPLVENAIYHGTKHKRAIGRISIEGREDGEHILLYVRDNGTGMSAERLEMLREGVYGNKHLGLGLVNVHRRIQLYYGDEYGLSFDSIPGEGMTVTVKIPKSVRTEI